MLWDATADAETAAAIVQPPGDGAMPPDGRSSDARERPFRSIAADVEMATRGDTATAAAGQGGSVGNENGDSKSYSDPSKTFRADILGIPLHRLATSPPAQLLVLAATVLMASVFFAVVQERVLYVPGFRYTGWMTTLTSLTYVCCALAERTFSSETRRMAPFVEYMKLSFLTMGGMYLTNWSLKYLSYPLRVVFKSSKLVPTMVLSVVYLNKKYTQTQYTSMALLACGVVCFTLGDAKGKAVFDPKGLVLIMVGSFMESMAANFEEKRLFNQFACGTTEVLLYSSMFGCVWSGIADIAQGDFLPALRHSRDHPEASLLICTAGVAGYVSMTGILILIKQYGATMAEIVKSCRKVLTICISFLLYGKPWTTYHLVGGLLFTASISVERYDAGGASRRFAGVLLAASSLTAGGLLLGTRQTAVYSVVIDAGSTATRINIFRFDAWTMRLLDIEGAAQTWLAQEPGLAAFASNQSAVASVLDPLMHHAQAVVPAGQWSSTPLALRANAGLAAIPGTNAPQLLAAASAALLPYGFQDAGVELFPGPEEAVCAWLTVNFLLGSFRPGVQALHQPVAVIDLRSISLQTAHYIRDGTAQAAKRLHRELYIQKIALPYGSGNAHVYRHSYFGHGLQVARGRLMVAAPERNPCLPTGAEAELWHEGRSVRATGAASPTRCHDAVLALFEVGETCGRRGGERPEDGRCTFAGVWTGPVEPGRPVVLMSYFFDRLREFGDISDDAHQAVTSPGAFRRAAEVACRTAEEGLEATEARFRSLQAGRAMWMCFDLSYLAVLLDEGFGFPAEKSLQVVKHIEYDGRSFVASWALGSVIRHMTR